MLRGTASLMSNVQAIADGRPQGAEAWPATLFEPALAGELQRLVARLDSSQRVWLSGYLAGTAVAARPAGEAPAVGAQPRVTILYGSQSGNCEQVARRLGEALAQCGIVFTTLDMLDCRKSHLQEAQRLLVIVSTHGEGEPPDRAKPLYELLHGRKAPRLEHLRYSVLALGDSSYEMYCETGRRFDAQLQELGAHRLHPRVECDVDFLAPSQLWIEAVAGKLASELASGAPAPAAIARTSASVVAAYTRKNPFLAPVLTNQRLTARGSSKDVRHIELSLEGSGIHYEPGDALGVVPRNHGAEVDALLAVLPYDRDAAVQIGPQTMALREALLERFDVGPITRSLVERYHAALGTAELQALLAPGRESDFERHLHGRHLIDLVTEHPPRGLDVAGFARLLRPLAPRLYSIASSQSVTPDEVHLTVALVTYESHGRSRRGVVSGALAELTGEEAAAPVYLHRNPAFRLPASADAPVIMIGPGTGVAPFRAFMAEREALGAAGRNWLFFGDRSFRSDFLYQAEWLELRKRGVLQRIEVAFSRDGVGKVYVQHRMREHGKELFAWLEDGAHLYVCGDAERMAPDVERALHDILRQHGGLTADRAAEYVLELQRERRYQKDVY